MLQDVAVDIFDRVAGLMIARIKRPPCRAAEQARLLFRLRAACAGVEPDRRDVLLGKRGAVAAESRAGALLDVQAPFPDPTHEFPPPPPPPSLLGRSPPL